MTANIAFKPISKVIEKIEYPKKIDTPSYPDKGTYFAGYSKQLIAGNQYKINPQRQFELNVTYTLGAGTTGLTIVNGLIGQGNFHYVNCIDFTGFFTAATIVRFQSNADNATFFTIYCPAGQYVNKTITLNTPIPVGNIQNVLFSVASALNDMVTFNQFGFIDAQ